MNRNCQRHSYCSWRWCFRGNDAENYIITRTTVNGNGLPLTQEIVLNQYVSGIYKVVLLKSWWKILLERYVQDKMVNAVSYILEPETC